MIAAVIRPPIMIAVTEPTVKASVRPVMVQKSGSDRILPVVREADPLGQVQVDLTRAQRLEAVDHD